MSCLYLMWSSLWCFFSLSPFSLIICALFIQTTSYPSYFRFSALNRCTFPMCALVIALGMSGYRYWWHADWLAPSHLCLSPVLKAFFWHQQPFVGFGHGTLCSQFLGYNQDTSNSCSPSPYRKPSIDISIYIYIYIYINYIYKYIHIYIYIYLPYSPRMVNFDDKTDIMLLG